MEKKARIQYLLSEEGRRQSLLNGGDGKMIQVIETNINEKIIKLSEVDEDGNVAVYIGHRFEKARIYDAISNYMLYDNGPIGEIKKINYFDKPMTIEELILLEETRVNNLKSKYDELKIKSEEIISKNKIKKELREEMEIEERREREIERQLEDERRKMCEKERQEEIKKYENEKSKWIELYGDQFLKYSLRLNDTIDKTYVIERANREFPDYEVDYDDNARWDEKSNPDAEILNEVKDLIEKGYCAKVVWLTNGVYDEDESDYFEERETIVIRKYLGRYDLVKII